MLVLPESCLVERGKCRSVTLKLNEIMQYLQPWFAAAASYFVLLHHISLREEIEKQKSKERYMKLHLEGKTEQARADLARLAIIKKQREEAAKKRDELRKGEKKQVTQISSVKFKRCKLEIEVI